MTLIWNNHPQLELAAFLLMLQIGCGDSNKDAKEDGGSDGDADTDTDGDSAGDGDSDTGPEEKLASCSDIITDGTIMLTDETNYTFTSTLQIQETTVKDATDITFDWNGLTKDFFGRPINAATDIDMVLATLWDMTPDVLAENIRTDNLPLSVNKGAITAYPNDAFTSRNLLSFTSPEGALLEESDIWRYFDTGQEGYQYPQDEYTFMLVAATGTALGKNSRMLGFFHLDPNSTNTTVALTDTSMAFSYSTNLVSTMPIPVPLGMPNLNVSWEYMITNAIGNTFVPTQITEVMVAHYPNYTRKQLDDQFLNLREIADKKWSGEVEAGLSIDLNILKDETDAGTFPGVDSTGVWLAALFCTKNCNNPAPWSITVLQACP